MSYKKSNWVPYDPTLSFEQNVTQGGTTTADKLNNMETGISNNDINKVNVSDMRKPASDVAGIDEVSTLQTQVDSSAVGTNLLTGTSNTQDYTLSGSGWALGSQSSNSNYHSAPAATPGKSYTYSAIVKSTTYDSYSEIQFLNSGKHVIKNHGGVPGKDVGLRKITAVAPENTAFVVAHMVLSNPTDSQTVVFNSEKLEKGNLATDWCPNPEDKVNVSDMRKPASDVAGIEEVNAKQDKIGYTPANDSKVAHLSGANNFNTVPTVNNNPLLLASSLPSDIARTGQDTNFTGKLQRNGKDVATTDDVSNASNTVLTSANTSISKLLQSSSNNDEDSAVTNSTSDTSNFYYWTE